MPTCHCQMVSIFVDNGIELQTRAEIQESVSYLQDSSHVGAITDNMEGVKQSSFKVDRTPSQHSAMIAMDALLVFCASLLATHGSSANYTSPRSPQNESAGGGLVDDGLRWSNLSYRPRGNYVEYEDEAAYPTTEEILDFIYPKSWTWALIFFHCIVFVVGLVGNCLVCVAVYRNHTMRTVTNYFIVNLAMADFLVILFCLPPSVVWDVTSTWWFGAAMCKIVLYLQSVSVTVSVLTLTFISIDRWYAICYPLKFKSTTNRAKTAICLIWIVALACEIPEPIYLTAVPYNESYIYFTQCSPTWTKETDTVFMIVKMVFFYFVPLLFMTVAYMQIIKVLWKSGNAPHQAMDHAGGRSGQPNTFAMNMNASTEGQLRSRRKAAKMLVAVVVMFAICFLPVHLLSVLRLTVKLTNSEVNRAFSLISHWLCYANSAVNPIIYNFMSGKFRKEFRRAFDTCFQRELDERNYYQYGGTFYNKDSGFASRTQSRNDYEIHKLNTYRDIDSKLTRKGTRTSVLQVDLM